jgi:putative addiction module component (TIGR02574 family)
MSITVEELEREARSLSPEERARLADVLLDSLRDAPLAEIESAWDREIEERVAAYDRGELKTFASEDVFAEARRLVR